MEPDVQFLYGMLAVLIPEFLLALILLRRAKREQDRGR